MSTRNSTLKLVLGLSLAVVVTVAGALAARYWLAPETANTDEITVLEPPRALPDVQLVDDQSQAYGLTQLRGQWSLLFFGFTHCPDICPNTLGVLKSVQTQLQASDTANPPQIVFVSVDPKRDTPEALRQYIRYFDESFTGVTGEIAEIRSLTQALYLPFGYTDNTDGPGYTVDHSAALVLLNPDAAARAYFTPPHAPDALAADIKTVMQAQ